MTVSESSPRSPPSPTSVATNQPAPLDDFRIVISVKLPDLSTYNLEPCCVDKYIPVTIVSPIVYNEGVVELTAGESSTSILFMSDSVLEDESSPFVKYLSIKQIDDLKEQKAKAIEESEELKEEGNFPDDPRPQLFALLKMVEDYMPSYTDSYLPPYLLSTIGPGVPPPSGSILNSQLRPIAKNEKRYPPGFLSDRV
jgi:hypothetical protein